MARFLLLLIFLCLCPAARAQDLFEQPAWRNATVSVLAVRTRDGAVLLSRAPDRLLVPASCLKLLTASRVLSSPLARERLETVVEGWQEGETVVSMVLVGGGDPTLTRADLHDMARDLVGAGIRQVEGDLEVRGRSGRPWGPGWAWEDMAEDFQPEVSDLTLGQGVVEVRVEPGSLAGQPVRASVQDPLAGLLLDVEALTGPPGSESALAVLRIPGFERSILAGSLATDAPPEMLRVSVPRPALWAGRVLREELTALGVRMAGEVRDASTRPLPDQLPAPLVGPGLPVSYGAFARHRSAPIPEVLKDALARSDNLAMELLWRRLPPADESGMRVVDGSGLSRYNLVSARRLLATLDTPGLVELLPRAGADGTMAKRFLDSPLAGRVVAKTGSMGGVSSLVGVIDPGTPDEIRFAIMTNGSLGPMAEVKRLEERLVEQLADR